MFTATLYFVSFFSVFLLVWAAGRAIPAALARNPELVAEYRREEGVAPWPIRFWRLGVKLAASELPESLLQTRRRQIERDLLRLGSPKSLTPEIFLGQALLEGAAIVLLLSLVLLAVTGSAYLLITLAIGLFYSFGIRPQNLRSKAAERVGKIGRRLPYAIDLAVLVLSAGGTLREALEVVCSSSREEPLNQELGMVLEQVRGAKSQGKALEDMAKRLQLEDVSSLVLAINRGEKTGSPMAKTLQDQAEIFRLRRLQRAERLAVEAPVKMMLPNMLIMIAVLLIVLGPVIVKLMRGDWM